MTRQRPPDDSAHAPAERPAGVDGGPRTAESGRTLLTDGGVPAPSVPESLLTDWERTEQSVETLFEIPAADVRGHTVVYEDAGLRGAVREATDGRLDRMWRFFFATRLTFRPPLPPGVGTKMVIPMVRREAEQAFLETLRERGFRDIERGRTETVRTVGRTRARLRAVSGTIPLDESGDLPVEGWVGIWTDGDIHLAGGAYPAASLEEVLADDALAQSDSLARSPGAYRTDLLDLIRRVGAE